MRGFTTTRAFLRNAAVCRAIFLTCSLSVLAPFSPAYAFDNYLDSDTALTSLDVRNLGPFAGEDYARQLSQLSSYVRKQAPNWVPGAPSIVRSPSQWLQSRLGLNSGDDSSSESSQLSSVMIAPAPEDAEGMWFSPDYRHKGFLPIDDAMIMGGNLRHRIFEDRLQFDVHPYAGQNWLSRYNYWGTEFGIGLRGTGEQQPWGKIVLRYNNGDSDLMDENRGFDMHTELNYDEHLGLNAGVRGTDNSDLGNYVLVRWKLLAMP